MARKSRMLPSYFIGILPQLDFAIIRARSNEILSGVEADPVAASLVPIQYLDTFYLHPDKRTQILCFGELLAENGEVPDTYS